MPRVPTRETVVSTRRGLGDVCGRLQELLGYLLPVPQEWLESSSRGSKGHIGYRGGTTLEPTPCSNYKDLISSWRKALKWTVGLDHALAAMLASISSTKSVGDQLWLKIIGPASCGKSTLCEALNVAQEYVISKDTFKGLSSGYQSDNEGSENLSLVEKIRDKTLIINDGDTLLQLPNLAQVISELRAFYSRNLRTSYKNKMSADHEGYNTTILLCGTSSLRKLDESELGERFLDVVLMGRIDSKEEDAILWRVANRAERDIAMESDGKAETRNSPEMIEAMELTGGYVCWLRQNALDGIASIQMSRDSIMECIYLGKFVAYMRARPSYRQEETAEREFGARLVSQLVRLSKCMALVLNRKEIDTLVMARVRQVAMDTSRGQTLVIADYLYGKGENGTTTKAIALVASKTPDAVRRLLRFLKQIEVVELYEKQRAKGFKGEARWRLTERMRTLYQDAKGMSDDDDE